MTKSGIVWTDQTWSPVTGCTKVSDGCKHCYAEREVNGRWSKNPKSVFFGRKFTDVQTHAAKLEEPLRWKKARRIFVCPRGDLFHEAVPDYFLTEVFAVMAAAKQHTFQVLTKRPERMRDVLNDGIFFEAVACTAKRYGVELNADDWPLMNVWIGVSVENQETADERIPLLLQTPAEVHWVSVEPMLGAVDLGKSCWESWTPTRATHIDWVVCGGESGPNARPMHPDWARSLRDQCAAADVQFLFKQWGEWCPQRLGYPSVDGIPQFRMTDTGGDGQNLGADGGNHVWMNRAGTKAAGRLLDGVLHDGYPAVQP